MTLDEIEAQVLEELGDINASEVFYDSANIQNWIYEAELKIARQTGMLEESDQSLTTVAGTATYNLPTDNLQIRKVEFNGYDVLPIDYEDLRLIDPRYTSAANAEIPTYWYEWANQIGFYPPPASAQVVTISHTSYPSKLTVGSSSPTVPEEYHPMIVTYCLARGKEMEEETQDALHFMAKFDADLLAADYEESVKGMDSYDAVRLVAGDDW